ncbi:MAG: hypothetical protein HC913_17835 [Microscillaceae bacterium]|nr:hypothetical protein [Microscillaceae bacterium]
MKTYTISLILSLLASLSAIMGEYALNMFRQMPFGTRPPAPELAKPASEQVKPLRPMVKITLAKPTLKKKDAGQDFALSDALLPSFKD